MRIQKKHLPVEALLLVKHVKMVQVTKAFLEHQGKPLQSFVVEDYKGKRKSKALITNSEKVDAKRVFKSKEMESNSNGRRRKRDTSKSVPKSAVLSKRPVAGLSSMQMMVPVPELRVVASAPAPTLSTVKPAKKKASVTKDFFSVKYFQWAGTEESGTLTVNQATEVLQVNNNDTGNENNKDGEGKNNGEDDNDDNGAMNVDTSGLVADTKFLELLHLKEVLQRALMEPMKAIKNVAPAPVNLFTGPYILVVDYTFFDESIFENNNPVDSELPTLTPNTDNPVLAYLYFTASKTFTSYVQESTENKDILLVTHQSSSHNNIDDTMYIHTIVTPNNSSTVPTADSFKADALKHKGVQTKKKYKLVTLKIKPVAGTVPEDFCIEKNIKGDPLPNMLTLNPNPHPFTPTGHFIEERKNQFLKEHDTGFLHANKLNVLVDLVSKQNQALAWEVEEEGYFKPEYFLPINNPAYSLART
ncbi:hypothetical protein C0995_016153 [Termitomyces sp. Mi166|nr:hypothetical protein C0995_016153 [Termitomyces sp. Mi166\